MPSDPDPEPRPARDCRKSSLNFPEWGLPRASGQIDTGAYSSALDVAAYEACNALAWPLLLRLRLALRPPPPG